MPMIDPPELTFSLDLRALRASIDVEEGDLVLHLDDGNQHIAIETGAGGTYAAAEAGAEHLADLALQFAGLVKVRAGSSTPLTPTFSEPTATDEPVRWWQPEDEAPS